MYLLLIRYLFYNVPIKATHFAIDTAKTVLAIEVTDGLYGCWLLYKNLLAILNIHTLAGFLYFLALDVINAAITSFCRSINA